MIAQIRGVEINYETGGPPVDSSPSALVLIHGFGASLRTWDPIIPALGETRRWLRLDLRGFGLSGHPRDEQYSIDENAEIVVELIERERLKRVVLVGHSYGGAVALIAIAKLRDRGAARVDGLVLIDAASYRQRLPFFVEVSRHRITRWLSRFLTIEQGSRFVLRALFFDKSLVDAAMVERYAFARRIPGADYSEMQTARQILPQSFDEVTRTIRSVDVPTQIIWGEHDAAVPPAFANRLHRDIKGSRVDVLSRAGHMPHEERTEDVIRIIAAFLAGLP